MLVSCMDIAAQNTVDIFYKDGSKTHYACIYWLTRPAHYTNHKGTHIGDSAVMYEHIRQVEEDFDNIFREINNTHPYAVLYYHKGDALLGYDFDIALSDQYYRVCYN